MGALRVKKIGYDEHMNLFFKSCTEWQKENYIEPSIRKSAKHIARMKRKLGIT